MFSFRHGRRRSKAVIPMVTFIYGIGLTAKVISVCLLALTVIVLNSYKAVANVNPSLLAMCRSFLGNRMRQIVKIILPDASPEDCFRRVEELREAAKQIRVTHRGLSVGAPSFSGGLAEFPKNGDTVEDLLRAADAALYLAKRAGRDRLMA